MSVENAAANILSRGVELDTKKRFTEALVCYQEGLQLLIDLMKSKNHSFIRNLITHLQIAVLCLSLILL